MSCCVKLNTVVICSSNLLDEETTLSVLNDSLTECGLRIENDRILIGENVIGNISISNRIVATTTNYLHKMYELRDAFTSLATTIRSNYISNLEREKKILQQKDEEFEKFSREIEELDKKIEKSEKAAVIQKKSACEALRDELTIAAEEKGFTVIEEKVGSSIQLQFIRNNY